MLRIPPGCINVTTQHGTHAFAVIGVGSSRNADNISIKRTAFHEAGHAVIGRTLGIASGGASIVPDDRGYDGHAIVAGHYTIHNDFIASGGYRDFLSSVFLKLQVCLAGPESERIAFGSADDTSDMRQIRELCSRYNISIVNVVDRQLRPEVHALLIKHWDAVERVAASLFDKRILFCDEIDALVDAQKALSAKGQ